MHGGMGMIEDGPLKGRKFIIPTEVLVEKGSLGVGNEFSLACLRHHKFIPSSGCSDCKKEAVEREEASKAIGLS